MVLSNEVASWFLYLTSCAFMALVTLFSWVVFSYSDAASEYEKTTQENKVTKAMKEQDVKYKNQEAASLDKTISELSSDRDNTNNELAAVNEYYGQIRERCIAKPETYEQRRARREADINGLKEALSILEGETAFL